ncbi:hypothetical protein [Salinibacterium sp.]|nr:hypothetical protein [Salinibacterium sp.]
MTRRKFAFSMAGTLALSAAIMAGGVAGADAIPTGDGDSLPVTV